MPVSNKQTIIRMEPREETTKSGRTRLVYRRVITTSDMPGYEEELKKLEDWKREHSGKVVCQ
jgi:hypothetical protein